VIGVIGGSGFIGSALVLALKRSGHEFCIIDRAPSQAYPDAWIEADVRDREGLSRAVAGCTIIYNLAAEHRDDVQPASLYHETNVAGAEHVCATAEAHGIEGIIFTSTVAVYGASASELDEAAPLRSFNEYGRSKLQAEGVYRAWAARGSGRSLTIVRPTVVFGPDNRGNVYTLLAQIARGRSVVIGDGRNRKSMAYVENVAELLVHALSFGPGVHVYNYADKPDLDMNELTALAAATLGDDRARRIRIPYLLGLGAGFAFDLAGRLTGWRFPVSAVRVRKYRANTQFSNARVLATGFVPRHDLRHALIATIHHEFGSRPAGAPPDGAAARQGQPNEELATRDRR
jgi:nucleoside-diphosphate-sugar epimerase